MGSKLLSVAITRLLPYFLLAIGAFFYGTLQFNKGYAKAQSEYEQAAYEEEVRVTRINHEAREAAKVIEEILGKRIEAQDEQIRRLSEEAARDPSAGNQSNSADSVRRLNQVR